LQKDVCLRTIERVYDPQVQGYAIMSQRSLARCREKYEDKMGIFDRDKKGELSLPTVKRSRDNYLV